MEFYINVILSRLNKELIFGVMRDFRIGGLNPDNYDKFISRVNALTKHFEKKDNSSKPIEEFLSSLDPSGAIKYKLFLIKHNLSEFNVKNINESDQAAVWKQIVKILSEKTKSCWHPEASLKNCKIDNNGKVKISSAHSIQRGKTLKYLAENYLVKQFKLNSSTKNINIPIKFASTFCGFCDTHDKIFDPIEKQDYSNSAEQNFLFAYRSFVHSSHMQLVFNELYDFRSQAISDINNNKEIFNSLILLKDYYKIVSDLIVLDFEYPIAVASASDLDFDFYGNKIQHSNYRMEEFFLTVFPQNGKTYVLFSYFLDDSSLYTNIFNQIRNRNSIESDLSVLIAGHCGNVFFNPSYYNKCIENQEINIEKLVEQTQIDFVGFDEYGRKTKPQSITPRNYLNNEFNIQLFCK